MIPVLAVAGIAVAGGAVTAASLGMANEPAPTTTTTIPATTTTTLPPQVTIRYSIEVVTDDYCSDFDDNGYDDLPYAEAEAFDGSGNLLGFGNLDGGTDTSDSCVFEATFKVDRSTDGKYRVTAGNNNRGYLNYSESELRNDVLTVEAIID